MVRSTRRHRLGNGALIALFDAGMVMVAVCTALLLQEGPPGSWVSLAGTHGGPLAAGVFFINYANGMADPAHRASGLALLSRTGLALLLALALTYAIFSQLPIQFEQRATLLATALIGISSIHLLKTFINAANYDDKVLIAQTAIHITFLLSAMAIAFTDKLMARDAAAH